jgi:hypothetical protein
LNRDALDLTQDVCADRSHGAAQAVPGDADRLRRMGLAISVVIIGITIFAIWALIRRLETRAGMPPDVTTPAGR